MKKVTLALFIASMLICTACGKEGETLEIITEATGSEISVSSEADTSSEDLTGITENEQTISETSGEIIPDEQSETQVQTEAVTQPPQTEASQTTAAQTTVLTAPSTTEGTTAAATTAQENFENAEDEVVISTVNDEELINDEYDAPAAALPFEGTWTVTKIADANGNESSLKEFCDLAEIKEAEMKSVYTIKSDGTITIKANGKSTEYSFFESDGNIIMNDANGNMSILMYDSAKKTISHYDETYGINLILTK